jgi:minor curlin subunit
MKSVKLLAIAAVAATPSLAAAQEAFIAQIGDFAASVTIPTQPRTTQIQNNISSVRARLDLPSFEAPEFNVDTFTTGDLRLIELTSGSSVADILSEGDNNTALISQTGIHAASIAQYGDNLTAAITQNGAGNRASVYQFGNGHSASISQSGTGNRALVIQN